MIEITLTDEQKYKIYRDIKNDYSMGVSDFLYILFTALSLDWALAQNMKVTIIFAFCLNIINAFVLIYSFMGFRQQEIEKEYQNVLIRITRR